MNRTSIEWTDYTWNPVVGCKNHCSYCYAAALCKRFAKPWGLDPDDPFAPGFYPERLDAPSKLKKPSKIFMMSMGELWGPWVPHSWQYRVLEAVEKAYWHTFLNLTKNPEGIHKWQYKSTNYIRHLPDNLWVGVSVDTPESVHRLTTLREDVGHPNKFVSFEPLRGDVASDPQFRLSGIRWIIIGAQTGPGAEQPPSGWVVPILEAARRAGIPVFVKNNLHWPSALAPRTQEFPVGFP